MILEIDQSMNIKLPIEQQQQQHHLGSDNNKTFSAIDDSFHGELSQIIHNLDKMNTKEILESLMSSNKKIINKEILLKNKFDVIVDEIIDLIQKKLNEGKDGKEDHVVDYLNNININLQELYDWLLS